MEILQDGIFEIICDFHEDLKEMCNKLNLTTAQDVKNFLKNTPKESKDRRNLFTCLSAIEFAEGFSSLALQKGREAMTVGAFDDMEVSADLMLAMFYRKIENLKEYLDKKNIDFDTLPFDEKFKEFQKTLILEDETVGMGFSQMFLRLYSKEGKKKKIGDKQNNSSTHEIKHIEDSNHSHHNKFPQEERVKNHFPLEREL